MGMHGGCTCGAVRYECSAAPVASFNCHCRDCQRASGSAFAALLFVPKAAFLFSKGEARFHNVTGDSGNVVSRGFCPNCGSPVVAHTAGHPERFAIQAASLDDPSVFRPAMNTWTSSAQLWDGIDSALPQFAKGAGR
jgi:hypothetical protein